MTLRFHQYIDLPQHAAGGFDHADVHAPTGRVFVAHTALDQVDIIDGEQGQYVGSIPNCGEASGVLTVPQSATIIAAARKSGQILILTAPDGTLEKMLSVGPAPNGLAWDSRRQTLLVADVQENTARILDVQTGATRATTLLPGRPRWCLYDPNGDRFWINIREPACVIALNAQTGETSTTLAIPYAGPHGLALTAAGHLLVACDSGDLVAVDSNGGDLLAHVAIAGAPDVIWENHQRHTLYVAIGQPGVVQVVDTRSLMIVDAIRTEAGAHTLTFDPDRQRLYVFLPQSCRVGVYCET